MIPVLFFITPNINQSPTAPKTTTNTTTRTPLTKFVCADFSILFGGSNGGNGEEQPDNTNTSTGTEQDGVVNLGSDINGFPVAGAVGVASVAVAVVVVIVVVIVNSCCA